MAKKERKVSEAHPLPYANKAKAFRDGFMDGLALLVGFNQQNSPSPEETVRKRLAACDESYLRESGDLERIGRDWRRVLPDVKDKLQK